MKNLIFVFLIIKVISIKMLIKYPKLRIFIRTMDKQKVLPEKEIKTTCLMGNLLQKNYSKKPKLYRTLNEKLTYLLKHITYPPN